MVIDEDQDTVDEKKTKEKMEDVSKNEIQKKTLISDLVKKN